MRQPLAAHTGQELVVHAIVRDFDLLDVWRFPIEIDSTTPLSAFTDHLRGSFSDASRQRGAAAFLFRLREWLGDRFGWDEGPRLPIPGCSELSVRARLPESERDRVVAPLADSFEGVFERDEEVLFEISNATVHALLHLGRVSTADGGWSPQMAVYARTRGVLGKAYLAAIAPFRHGIVYPALMRGVAEGWAKREDVARAAAPPPD